jgi:hypothetical protein
MIITNANRDLLHEVWDTPISHPAVQHYTVDIEISTPFKGSVHRFLPKSLYTKLTSTGAEDLEEDSTADGKKWQVHRWFGNLDRTDILSLLEFESEGEQTENYELPEFPDRLGIMEFFETQSCLSQPHIIHVYIRPVLEGLPQEIIEAVTLPIHPVETSPKQG